MVLEVHRALHHNGSADVQELRKKEAELRRQLQVRAAAAALASFERGWAGQIGLVAVMVRLLLMNS